MSQRLPQTFQGPQPNILPPHPSIPITDSCPGYQPAPIFRLPQTFQGPQPNILPPHPSIPIVASFQGYQPAPRFVPPPVIFPTGANNQTLVSIADLQEKFAIPYIYGDTSKPWPHTTILLYKYSSNAITKYPAIPENTWQRIDNFPRNAYNEGEHAESILIKKMTKTQEHLKKQPYKDRESYNGIHTIEVILNYSPCNVHPHCCSTKLCDFKNILERDVSAHGLTLCSNDSKDGDDDFATMFQSLRTKGNVDIKITFANFYQHYYQENMEGLKELLSNDIELDLLTGDTWLSFFDAVGLDRTTELPIGRKEREKVDEKILEKLMLEIHEL